ncbi:MAG TPA: sulfur transferase domain-containing protein [Gemmatimonadales bacterium]|nr:sulfur transferase domain-containing protein [Gemmatimonadales bacterium]
MSDPFGAIHGVTNACQLAPGLVTGGQPEARHLEALAAAGGGVVLDIRDPMEPRSFDEPAYARQLGLEYVNVPVSPATLSDDTIERILTVVREAAGRTVFFHCGSGNRVGGALIPWFLLDQGMDEEAAIEQAMRVGLRSPAMLEWGLEYARRKAGA